MSKFNEYKARLEFWWATKTLKDGRDFDLTFDQLGLLVSVLRGKYKGVQFRFANMVMHEDGLLDFSTVVVYNPSNGDVSTDAFIKLTNNILRIILTDAVAGRNKLNVKETQPQVNDENRDTDFSQPLEERDIHEESSPVLEKRISQRKPRKKVVRTDSGSHPQVQQPTKPKRTSNRNPRKKGSDGE